MAQTTAAVYSAAAVTVSLGGIDIDQDAMGTEDFVSIEPQVKAFSVRVGLGGAVTYSKTLGLWDKVTIKVRQCAAVNNLLAALFQLDLNTEGGAGIVPLYIKDRNGNYKHACMIARLESNPGWTAGAEEKDLDWVVLSPGAETFAGGH